MTTTTKKGEKKIRKVLDAAIDHGWDVTVDETKDTFKITAENIAVDSYQTGKVIVAFWHDDINWKVDYAQTFSRNHSKTDWSYSPDKISMTGAIDVLNGANSPKVQAAKAVAAAERAAIREAAQAAYAAEGDSVLRKALRRELVAVRDAHSARDTFKEHANGEFLSDNALRYAEDAYTEQEMMRLATNALAWEGIAAEDNHVVTLEEAVTRTADGALRRILGEAERGENRSSSMMHNVAVDMTMRGCVLFVKKFHPVLAQYGSAWWGYREDAPAFDMAWVGRNSW